MISVRTVYPDHTETRSRYESLRGDTVAMLRAVYDVDMFQGCARTPLSEVSLFIRLNAQGAKVRA